MQSPDSTSDCVHILMAVYQGEDHLAEQMDSLAAQTHSNWQLIASIDTPEGDSDKSEDILRSAAGKTKIVQGPNAGAAANFLSLMQLAPPGEVWAFADQDDVWLPYKLERALDHLNKSDPDTPTMYCARLWITDNKLENRRLSPPRPSRPSFENALVQNIASGNTIVLNPAATRIVAEIAAGSPVPVVHDWWLYQVVSGIGGTVIHDDEPVILYRQHDDNVIGANDSWRARMTRLGMVLSGVWQDWLDRNTQLLRRIEHRLTDEARETVNTFEAARHMGLVGRLRGLRKSRVRRQSKSANVTMWIAALLGRL